MAIETLLAPAQLIGYVALILGVSAFLQKNDTRLKVLVACESLAYVAHFFLLHNLPASGSALISCLRNLISVKSRSPWWVAVFVAANLAVGAVFGRGFLSWLPVIASCLASGAIFLLRGVLMRMILLVCTLLWLANNVLSGSVGGTVLEAIIAIANLTTIVRLLLERFPPTRKPCPAK